MKKFVPELCKEGAVALATTLGQNLGAQNRKKGPKVPGSEKISAFQTRMDEARKIRKSGASWCFRGIFFLG